MTLRAQIQSFPLETVLQLLAATEKTGRLEVRGDDGRGFLGVSAGRLVSAEFEDETGRRALGAIFTVLHGDLEFIAADHVEREDLTGDLDELLDQAVEERDRIAKVREVIPSERVRFRLSERAADKGQIVLSSDQWRALLAVDGERDVAGIAEKVGMTRLATEDLLATLVRAGMVDPIDPPVGAGEASGYRRLPPMAPIPPTAAGETVVLRGSLPEFPLETVLQLLAATGKTGRVELGESDESATLGVAEGRLVSATAGEEDGELALGAAFAIPAGGFDFVPTPDAPAANLSGDLDELLDRAATLRDRIGAVRALIPNERARFSLSERATRNPEITLSPEQWRVLLAVHPQRDVGMVAEHLRMRRLPTLMLLTDLIRGGFVDVVAPDAELSWPYVERRRTPWATPSAEPVASEGAEASAAETPAAETPAAEIEQPLAETPLDREPEAPADDRLSALSGLFGPAEPAPPPSAWEPPPASPEAAAAEATAAAFTWPPPSEAEVPPEAEEAAEAGPPAETEADAWTTPAWETPAETTAESTSLEEPTTEAPAEIDPRLAAFSAMPPAETEAEAPAPEVPEEPAWPEPTHVRPEPVVGQPLPELPVQGEVPPLTAEKKRGGLFGGLFGAKPQAAGKMAPASLARTSAGQLAFFANELIAGYNSGQYGKARVEDRMIGLLMRVDEQADPIDRPIPVTNDRIDVASIDDGALPESQSVPYLATLVRQIYDDAERALGKDKARRGFRDVRDRVFGKNAAVLHAPAVAGRMPKV